ncbi:MAG: hypothetical protein JXB85_03005 [Anaerolineales bacterium]|nr:hypothetical protein [Anaerolineales bacterium]
MYQDDTDLLFPVRIISELREIRNDGWRTIINQVRASGADSPAETAFVLMMVRLNGCATCYADSYRAMQGCLACSQQTLKRQRGTDEDLQRSYLAACLEVEEYLRKNA